MVKKSRYRQGYFVPQNPQKYKGNHANIVYRSSWELTFYRWADLNPTVLEWSSEEVVIPYLCETDNRIHRYFVDAYIKVKQSTGEVKQFLVEIKPEAQATPPKFPGRQTRRYLTEVTTFIKNQSKWKAAKKYAEARGMEFIVITEKDLGLKK